ncbi:MAG: class II aldolase/adducin family protein [Nitrospiraceae bacterium]
MLTAIGDVMRRVYERGWITTRDGNISMRKKRGTYLYITPSGWRKTTMHPEHIVRLDVVEDPVTRELVPDVRDRQKPSGEPWMHWNLQRSAPKTRTVVHVHATHVVAAIYAGFDLQVISAEFPEISQYTRVGPTVEALPALSRELADATAT